MRTAIDLGYALACLDKGKAGISGPELTICQPANTIQPLAASITIHGRDALFILHTVLKQYFEER